MDLKCVEVINIVKNEYLSVPTMLVNISKIDYSTKLIKIIRHFSW